MGRGKSKCKKFPVRKKRSQVVVGGATLLLGDCREVMAKMLHLTTPVKAVQRLRLAWQDLVMVAGVALSVLRVKGGRVALALLV